MFYVSTCNSIDSNIKTTESKLCYFRREVNALQQKLRGWSFVLKLPYLSQNRVVREKMNLKKRHLDDISILELDGMLTLGAESTVAEAFKELHDLERKKIILDMLKVKYIDSIGIGQIASGYKKIKENGGQLVLVRVNERILSLLEMTGLKDVLPIYPDVEHAIDIL
ncbi:MAG: hypothetical protein CSA81_03055 [Acidobacteria bacterium]|nr:MAG: hypothetical protein CSA81_03055 [Acidobacteriota bacterium]